MTKVLAIANKKGGVGKTTTSSQITYFFGELCSKPDGSPLKILAIDFDSQGNYTTSFGVDKDDEKLEEKTIAEFLTRKSMTIDDVKIPVAKNIDLIPANDELENVNIYFASNPVGSFVFYEKLKSVVESNIYDYIIIDTAPAMSIVVENALIASTEIVIPVEAEKWAFEGISDFLVFINKINRKIKNSDDYNFLPKRNILGVVFTKIDARLNRHKAYVENGKKDIKNAGYNCFNTEIHLCSTIGDSQTENKSVFEYQIKSRASIEYTNLCKEIIEKEKENENAI